VTRVGFEGVVCTSGEDVDCFGERAEDVIFIGIRKRDHVLREDLRETLITDMDEGLE